MNEIVLQRCGVLFGCTVTLAVFLTYGLPNSFLLNLPLAVLILLGGFALWYQHEEALRKQAAAIHAAVAATGNTTARHAKRAKHAPTPSHHVPLEAAVGSQVVQFAWEKLCGSIIQQFVYDIWWQQLSPDCEFPAEARAILNHAFGQVCARARYVDVQTLLIRDVSKIIGDGLQQYRTARDAIGAAPLASLAPEARDRAIHAALWAMGSLHPALVHPEGHYKVLRTYADALLTVLLPPPTPGMRGKRESEPSVTSVPLARAFGREVVTTCLLRPVMMYLWPHWVFKLALPVLKAAAEQPPRKRSSTPAPSGQQLPPVTSKQELRGPTASSLTSATSKSDLGGVGDSGSSNAGNSAKPETAPSRLSVSSQPTTASGAAAQSVQLNAAVSTVQSTVQAQAEAGGDSTSLMEFEARCVASATREYELMTRLGRFRRRSLEAMGGMGRQYPAARTYRRRSPAPQHPWSQQSAEAAAFDMRTQALDLASPHHSPHLPTHTITTAAGPTQPQQAYPDPAEGSMSGSGTGTGPRHRRTHSHDSTPLAGAPLLSSVARTRTSLPVGATPGLHNRTQSFNPAPSGIAVVSPHTQANPQDNRLTHTEGGVAGEGLESGHVSHALAAAAALAGASGTGHHSHAASGASAPRANPAHPEGMEAAPRGAPSGAEGVEWLEGEDWGLLGSRPSGDVAATVGQALHATASAPAPSRGCQGYVYDAEWLRASVVAPEIKLEGGDGFGPFGGKVEVVVYKIRVEVDTRCLPQGSVLPQQQGQGQAQQQAQGGGRVDSLSQPHQAPPHRNALITSWTVAHRYSDFEALHTCLGKASAASTRYKALGLAPPPKRLVMLTHDAKFIAKRREELDAYLQALLRYPDLATSPDLLNFLRCPQHLRPYPSTATSPNNINKVGTGNAPAGVKRQGGVAKALYGNKASTGAGVGQGGSDTMASTPDFARLSSVGVAGFGDAGESLGRLSKIGSAMGAALGRLTGGVGGSSREMGLAAASTGGGEGEGLGRGEACQERLTRAPTGRVESQGALGGSVSSDATGVEWGSEEGHTGQGVPREGSSASAVSSAARAGSFQAGTQRVHGMMKRGVPPRPSDPVGSNGSVHGGSGEGGSGTQSPSAAVQGLRTSTTSGLSRPSAPSIATMQIPGRGGGGGVQGGGWDDEESDGSGVGGLSGSWPAPGGPSEAPSPTSEAADTPSSTGATTTSVRQALSHTVTGAGGAGGGTPPHPAHASPPHPLGAASGGAGGQAGNEGPTLQGVGGSGGGGGGSGSGTSKDARVPGLGGGSAPTVPLYELIDRVFLLSSKGFFGRQVVAVARQMLSVVAGDAIDEAIAGQIKAATSEHAIARHLLTLQRVLWPSGCWYAWAQQQQQGQGQAQQQGQQQAQAKPPPFVMKADSFLVPGVAPTPEETQEAIKQVQELLLGPLKPPAAIMSVLGRTTYASGVNALIEVAATPTLMFQMGYAMLECAMVALAPELQAVVDEVHAGLGGPGGS